MTTTPVILAAGLAAVLTALCGFWLLPVLRKLHFGQTILDIGPEWHKSKQGTPTMGGLMFLVAVPAAVVAGSLTLRAGEPAAAAPGRTILQYRVLCGVLLALLLGTTGFLDDWLKVTKRQNEGLTEKQKLALQIASGAVYLVLLRLCGDRSTGVTLPFVGVFDFGPFYYVFALLAIVAIANAVNFTDGLDGLLSSVTFVFGIGYIIFTLMMRMPEMAVLAGALSGGALGFLVWNRYPAKVFMGDTGSLFLSGMVISLAFGTGLPCFVALFGVVYVAEIASVVLQRIYFRATHGRRIFLMSPIHHHFEMKGYTEKQIVAAFSAVTAVGGALGILAFRLM